MFSIHSTECILQQDTKKHAHALTEELPRCREHLVPVFTNILLTQIQSTHLHLLHYWPTTDQSTHTSPPCTSHIDSCVLKVPPPLVTPTLTSVMTPPPQMIITCFPDPSPWSLQITLYFTITGPQILTSCFCELFFFLARKMIIAPFFYV